MNRKVRWLRLFAAIMLLPAMGDGGNAQRSQAAAPVAGQAPSLEERPLPPVPQIRLPEVPPIERARPLSLEEYREGAFMAAQWAFRSDAAVALDRLAARFAGGESAIGTLEAELLELGQSRRAVEYALSSALQASASQAPQNAQELRTRLGQLEVAIRAKLTEIERRFPRYSEFVRPRAYGFEAVRALLRPDEVLLLIVSAEDASYIFAVSNERFQWYRTADLPRAEIESAVARLRASLDVRRTPFGSGAAGPAAPDFDRRLAHRLYRGLIAPAQEIIGDRPVLMTVTSGALATLPLNVLVTAPPAGDDGDREALSRTAWLAERNVLTVLPSVSSLVALRCLLVAVESRSRGCPAELPSDPSSRAPELSLALAGAGAPVLLGRTVEDRGDAAGIAPIFGYRQLADPEIIRNSYGPLEGAKAELEALRDRFPGRSRLLIGPDATEQRVKQSPEFASARYVIFATHGVLGGRAGSNGEPGLIFTPPAAGRQSELDDGFLGASEIAQMRFNADLIVLSACNTAASNGGPGGEGLSGLARAFFYAGARSLLVSHWKVDDAATSALMTETFGRFGDASRTSRGEAVRQAIRALRQNPAFTHPRYWAAFSLVGEVR